MSDNKSGEEQQEQMERIFICDDIWLEVFAFLSPFDVGLKMALISDRLDVLVDVHFESREWSLEIVKYRSRERLPIPHGPPPGNVIGFESISIGYVDQSVIEFLQRIRRLFDSTETNVDIRNSNDQSRCWEIIWQKIWPLVNDNICGFSFNSSQLDRLRQFSPAILRNCAKLRSIDFQGPFPWFPARDNAGASSVKAVTKWLLTPRGDGLPNMLRCGRYSAGMEGFKRSFVKASEPVNFIIKFWIEDDDDWGSFEEKNNLTGEQLTLRCFPSLDFYDEDEDEFYGDTNDKWLLVRCPIGREEDKWTKWEKETIELDWDDDQWNCISIDFNDRDIGDGMIEAKAGPITSTKASSNFSNAFAVVTALLAQMLQFIPSSTKAAAGEIIWREIWPLVSDNICCFPLNFELDSPTLLLTKPWPNGFICADVWYGVFAFLSPFVVGLKMALVSDRLDVLVDVHFKSREWSLGRMDIYRVSGENDAKIVFKHSDNKQNPICRPLPKNVIGFKAISIHYVDQTGIEFLQRIRPLLDSSGTNVQIYTYDYQSRSWEIIRQKIWPLVNDNISGLFLDSSDLDCLRQFSPTVLRNCAKLRSIHSFELFPEFPAQDNAGASSCQALAKWLNTPLGDGLPKILHCVDYCARIEGVKGSFVNASEPANFIIKFLENNDFVPFELTNNFTRERLMLRRLNEDTWKSTGFWLDIGGGMDEATASPREPVKRMDGGTCG
uniref:F-box domain-containing protein n=1 Tax=Globodera rostochiensis TaxID=31243 RepID=A0A914IF83_GLORO